MANSCGVILETKPFNTPICMVTSIGFLRLSESDPYKDAIRGSSP